MQLIAFYEDEPVKAKNAAVVQVPFADSTAYTFGNEPTMVKTVYVRHPRIDQRLVPYGQYDSLVMTDKFNEALRIVQTLGAHTVITRSYRGDESRFSLKAHLPQGHGGVDAVRSNREEIAFEQLGTGGPPQDPGPSVYSDVAGFEAARRGVLQNGARQVTISIESQSAFRVDSDIASRLKKVGFSLGATGEQTQVRLLRLEAYFPERGKLHVPDEAKLAPLLEPKPRLDPDAAEAKRLRRRR